jgi:hypothetical protein
MILTVALDNTIRCWDEMEVRERFKMVERQGEVSCAALMVTKDMSLILTGNDNGTITWFDLFPCERAARCAGQRMR